MLKQVDGLGTGHPPIKDNEAHHQNSPISYRLQHKI
ncbi:hypothetical protein A2U01_0089381, partial [Trifolium medium]|nr:hypothetical protein [Trifolium medium]